MDLGTLTNALLLVLVAGLGAILFSRRLDRIDGRIDRIPTRQKLDARFDGVTGRLAQVESEVAALRAAITQIALAVGAKPQPQTG